MLSTSCELIQGFNVLWQGQCRFWRPQAPLADNLGGGLARYRVGPVTRVGQPSRSWLWSDGGSRTHSTCDRALQNPRGKIWIEVFPTHELM